VLILVDLILGDTAASEEFDAVDVTAVVGDKQYRHFTHTHRLIAISHALRLNILRANLVLSIACA
jgi:hypothetical protein